MPDDQTIVEGDAGFLGMASRLNPLQLQPGMCQFVENMRLDRGVAQTRKGAKLLTSGIAAGDTPLTVPFALANDVVISSITFSGTTATVTTSAAHGYSSTNKVNIRGASEALYNGDFIITVTNSTTFTYTMLNTPAANATGALRANKGPIVSSTYTGGIFASGVYSSPRYDNASELVVLVTSSSAYLWKEPPAGIIATIGFPNTDTTEPDDEITVLQAFDKLYLHRHRPSLTYKRPTSVTQTGGTTTVTLNAHGYSTNDVVRITGSSAAAHNADHTITSTDPNTFTFASTLDATSTVTITSANPGVVTWNNHNLSNGQAIQFTTTGALPTALVAGTRYYVVAAAANTFQVASTIGGTAINTTSGTQSGVHTAWAVPDVSNFVTGNTLLAQRVLPTLVWDGNPSSLTFTRVATGQHPAGVSFSRMPAGSVAAYINNQTLLARGRDEILVSDVLDAETYDPLLKSFRANQGSNDHIVAIHPYAEGQALIFGRKSIYLATAVMDVDGVSLDPVASRLQLLTNEIGCLAPKSIATAGVFVFFLSDSGVYRLDNQFDLKLRGNTQPLSDPIADLLLQIDPAHAHKSSAIYFNNRYYLSLTRSASATPAGQGIHILLSYNMLNQQWEYLDTFGFEIQNLLVTDYGTQRRLFIVNRPGGIFLLDEYESGADDTQSGISTNYQGSTLLTRRYGWGSLNAKRLTRSKASLVLPSGAACTLDAVTTDFDSDFQIASLTNSTGQQEDYTLKAPLRRKATALDLRFRTTAGRPILRQISAEAVISNFDPTETRTLN
jgi:hypothetical protein